MATTAQAVWTSREASVLRAPMGPDIVCVGSGEGPRRLTYLTYGDAGTGYVTCLDTCVLLPGIEEPATYARGAEACKLAAYVSGQIVSSVSQLATPYWSSAPFTRRISDEDIQMFDRALRRSCEFLYEINP